MSYHNTLDFTPCTDSVILVDESDAIIYKQPDVFAKKMAEVCTICMSGTQSSSSDLEKEIIEHLKLKEFKY